MIGYVIHAHDDEAVLIVLAGQIGQWAAEDIKTTLRVNSEDASSAALDALDFIPVFNVFHIPLLPQRDSKSDYNLLFEVLDRTKFSPTKLSEGDL